MGANGYISRRNSAYSPNDVLFTPPEIFEALNVQFDMDVCAPVDGVPWIPANRFIGEEEDGLSIDWSGVVWLNPPYSNPTPWINKWLDHKNGICLVPFTRSKWFIKLWDSDAAAVAANSDIKFIRPDGSRYGIFMPVVIFALGETNITALKMSNLGRIR